MADTSPARRAGLPDPDYLAETLALAMIRSAMIRHAQLSRDPDRETVPTSVPGRRVALATAGIHGGAGRLVATASSNCLVFPL